MSTKINKLYLPKFLLTAVVLIITVLLRIPAQAQESSQQVTSPSLVLHLFYSETCPHCADEKEFLIKMQSKYPSISVKTYEVSQNRENLKLFVEVEKKLGEKSGRVPFLVIGQEYILGYLNEETHGTQIEQKVVAGLENTPADLVQNVIDEKESSQPKQSTGSKEKLEMTLPLLGKIDIYSLALPILTVILGLIDGFNPCAMWALLFLISILLETKDKTRMWLLGGTFIFVSGLVYFLFMAARRRLSFAVNFLNFLKVSCLFSSPSTKQPFFKSVQYLHK